jgi:hypothetical protein
MGTDMNDTPGTQSGGLKGSFKKGTSATINYGHPHAKALMESAYEVLQQSESARLFLRVVDTGLVPVHIIKGTGESGYSPDLNTIYMQAPAKMEKASGTFILQLAKAVHEATQEHAGFKTPDPTKDIMAYASFIHGRNLDSITETCQIVKELTNSSEYPELLDSLAELGLNGVYKAYIAGKSRDELYEEYVSAYDIAMRGN